MKMAKNRREVEDFVKRVREARNELRIETLVMENRLREIKQGDSNTNKDSRDKANTEENVAEMVLKIMQNSMDRNGQLNAEELDKNSLCNSETLNLDVGGSSYSEKSASQDSEEDDEEFYEEENDEVDDEEENDEEEDEEDDEEDYDEDDEEDNGEDDDEDEGANDMEEDEEDHMEVDTEHNSINNMDMFINGET